MKKMADKKWFYQVLKALKVQDFTDGYLAPLLKLD